MRYVDTNLDGIQCWPNVCLLLVARSCVYKCLGIARVVGWLLPGCAIILCSGGCWFLEKKQLKLFARLLWPKTHTDRRTEINCFTPIGEASSPLAGFFSRMHHEPCL